MLVILTTLLLCNYVLAYDGENRAYYDLAEAEEFFSWFVETYNKTYTNHEAKMRFQIFKQNLKTINEDNFGLSTPVFGINKFADLTVKEFIQKYTGLKFDGDQFVTYCNKKTDIDVPMLGDVPDQFDWRDHKAVTSVKSQRICGSCWAFGATGTVEGAYAIKNKKLVDLSAQQLVDCDKRSHGCLGGLPSAGWLSIMELGGQEKEDDYKYTGHTRTCKFVKSKVEVKLKSCSAYKIDEEKAKQLLYQRGPLSILVDATIWHLYNSDGIVPNFTSGGLNHAVLLVGYGKANGKDYWIVKNSWGTDVGDKGYYRIERGKNACGLLDYYFETVELA